MDIKEYIKTPCRVFEFDTIDSTNDEAKRMLKKDPFLCPFAVVANGQTSGRGRQGKIFYSPVGTGIYMSVAFEIKNEQDMVFFTSAAAVAVAEAIEKFSNRKTGIKWVNDIYIDKHKVCGILCESFFAKCGEENKRFVISGIGINLSTENFPDEIKETAASVGKLTCEKNRLIAEIADGVFDAAKDAQADFIFEKYRQKSCVIGKGIRYLQNNVWNEGVALDIDREGRLEVVTPSGEKLKLSGGEVTLRFINGQNGQTP